MATRAYVLAQLLNAGSFVVSSGLIITSVYLLSRKKASVHHSHLLRRALIGYVAIMGILSFVAFVWDSMKFIEFIHYLTLFYIYGKTTGPVQDFSRDTLRPVLPPILWCAEAFMVWRVCVHIQPKQRSVAFLLGCLTMALAIISIVSGIPVLISSNADEDNIFKSNYRFFVFSAAAVNIILSGMITVRLIIWDRVLDGIEKTLVSYSKAVTRILVASGAPLTLISILAGCFFKFWIADWAVIPIFVMPQICAISTILIVCGISQRTEESYIRLPYSPLPVDATFRNAEDA